MAEDGIVGDYNGSQAREVMISLDDWEAMSRQKGEGAAAGSAALPGGGQISRPPSLDLLQRNERITNPVVPASPPAPRRNRIVPDPDEPNELEEDDSVPFDAGDEDTFADQRGELASASGDLDDDFEEESEDTDEEWDDDDSDFDESDEDDEESDDEDEESNDAEEEWDEEEEEEDVLTEK
jgi:hypothetical protein